LRCDSGTGLLERRETRARRGPMKRSGSPWASNRASSKPLALPRHMDPAANARPGSLGSSALRDLSPALHPEGSRHRQRDISAQPDDVAPSLRRSPSSLHRHSTAALRPACLPCPPACPFLRCCERPEAASTDPTIPLPFAPATPSPPRDSSPSAQKGCPHRALSYSSKPVSCHVYGAPCSHCPLHHRRADLADQHIETLPDPAPPNRPVVASGPLSLSIAICCFSPIVTTVPDPPS
jgi:hypothetical protein